MSKNSLLDLNDLLMTRLVELDDDKLDDEQLMRVVKRAEASVKIAGAVVENGRLMLDGARFMADQGVAVDRGILPMLPSSGKAEPVEGDAEDK